MKLNRWLLFAMAALLMVCPADLLQAQNRGGSGAGQVYVKGYWRKDGTWVSAHTRSRPDQGQSSANWVWNQGAVRSGAAQGAAAQGAAARSSAGPPAGYHYQQGAPSYVPNGSVYDAASNTFVKASAQASRPARQAAQRRAAPSRTAAPGAKAPGAKAPGANAPGATAPRAGMTRVRLADGVSTIAVAPGWRLIKSVRLPNQPGIRRNQPFDQTFDQLIYGDGSRHILMITTFTARRMSAATLRHESLASTLRQSLASKLRDPEISSSEKEDLKRMTYTPFRLGGLPAAIERWRADQDFGTVTTISATHGVKVYSLRMAAETERAPGLSAMVRSFRPG